MPRHPRQARASPQLTARVRSLTPSRSSQHSPSRARRLDLTSIRNDQERHPVHSRRDKLRQLRRLGRPGPAAWPAVTRRPGGRPSRSASSVIVMHTRPGRGRRAEFGVLTQLVSHGVPFDVIGLSYSPSSRGDLGDARQRRRARRPVPPADRDRRRRQYPWTLANGNFPLGDGAGDFVWQNRQLSPGYPARPGGQLSFVTDELSILAQVPDGLGAGLFYGRRTGSRRAVGAGDGHRLAPTVRPHPVQLRGRGAPLDRHLRQPGRRLRTVRAGQLPLRSRLSVVARA